MTRVVPLSSAGNDSPASTPCSICGAACSITDTWGVAGVAPSAHLTETNESGSDASVVASAVLNLILALSLAPRFGALGMAWVTVVAEGCIMVGLLWALRRRGLRPLTPDLLRRGFAALPRR